jgi:hypothetical protein
MARGEFELFFPHLAAARCERFLFAVNQEHLMKVSTTRWFCSLLALSACWNCGGTPQVAGDWSGRVAPNHFDYLELRLTQEGSVIRGTACYEVLGSTSSPVKFRDAAVTGKYPTITVSAPSYNGWTFTGEFQDDGTLSGQWHNRSVPDYPMSLTRGGPPNGMPCFGP